MPIWRGRSGDSAGVRWSRSVLVSAPPAGDRGVLRFRRWDVAAPHSTRGAASHEHGFEVAAAADGLEACCGASEVGPRIVDLGYEEPSPVREPPSLRAQPSDPGVIGGSPGVPRVTTAVTAVEEQMLRPPHHGSTGHRRRSRARDASRRPTDDSHEFGRGAV
jgi:hypothetical protein